MFDVVKYENQLKSYQLKKSVGRKDFKYYLITLAYLTRHISKDATSYANVSPITKKWITGFKPIFGNLKFNHYSSSVTITCVQLLKCFRQFEPNYSYEFYCDWRDIMTSSTSSKRAELFITHIREFEFVVQHLRATENRWNQLVILGILQLYTKAVKHDDIIGLRLQGCDTFMDLMEKIITLQHQKQASIIVNNAFLNDLNSMGGNILSFQPYKIICENDVFIVTDYDLWIDFNIKTESITFFAFSVVDKTENVYGMISTTATQSKIVSNQDHTISIKDNWNLSSKSEFMRSDDQIEIVFHFSARVHNSILESKLRSVFDVAELHKHILSDKSFLNTVLGINTSSMPDEPMLSSKNEIRLVGELEKLEIQLQTKNQITQPILTEENIGLKGGGQVPDMIKTLRNSSKADVHQSSSINIKGLNASLTIEDTKIGTNEPLVTCKKSSAQSKVVKKRFRKRRSDQMKEGDTCSTDEECSKSRNGEPFRKYRRVRKRVTNLKTKSEESFETIIFRKPVNCESTLIGPKTESERSFETIIFQMPTKHESTFIVPKAESEKSFETIIFQMPTNHDSTFIVPKAESEKSYETVTFQMPTNHESTLIVPKAESEKSFETIIFQMPTNRDSTFIIPKAASEKSLETVIFQMPTNHEPTFIVPKAESEKSFETIIFRKPMKREPTLTVQPISTVESATPQTVTTNNPIFEIQQPVIRSRSPNDPKYIQILAEEIVTAANEVSRQLANITSTLNKNDQLNDVQNNYVQCLPQVSNPLTNTDTSVIAQMEQDEQNMPTNLHCATDNGIYFDYKIYCESWPIRKFVWSLRMEEQENFEDITN